MSSRRFAAVLVLILFGAGNIHGQQTGDDTSSGLRQLRMQNRYPLLFSPAAGETPSFGFFLRRYDGEGERGTANDVSYLGWNPLGLDTATAGMWLNFENDYHGWFEHNLDVRTARGAFVRRMKTAIDRNDGQGVSMSWAYDHFTFHHGGADAGGDSPQVDFALDRSPDFTTVSIAGQLRTQRRIVSEAAVLRAEGDIVIDWKHSNVIDLKLVGPSRLLFRNHLPGQHLTVIVRNPGRHPLRWPDAIRWPEGSTPPPAAPLLRCGFLAIEGLVLADAPMKYPNTGSAMKE
ncbi:MAG: hypothetical protein KFF77_01460 [Bacteroidetes bacterium]|nr:hypothetical protein [Bacteroidota bacterium]